MSTVLLSIGDIAIAASGNFSKQPLFSINRVIQLLLPILWVLTQKGNFAYENHVFCVQVAKGRDVMRDPPKIKAVKEYRWHFNRCLLSRNLLVTKTEKEKQLTREFSSQQEFLPREVFPNEL